MAWPNGTPKYDLHRHFGGSISPATVAKLLGHKVELSEVAHRMMCTGPSRTFKDFLDKFNILNEITWTEKAIELSIFQVVEDLSADMIDYAEISFSIDKYMADKRWNRPELIKYVSDVFKSACSKWNTSVGLILSLRMEAPREHQLVNASLINRSDVADRLAGIDIVGDESKFDTKFYRPIFKDWRAGLFSTVRCAVRR
jgi:adenosine deaminase